MVSYITYYMNYFWRYIKKLLVLLKPTTWTHNIFCRADEMDEDDRDSRYGRSEEKFVLPTAPRAARGPDMSDERIPKDPPYTAYIANLSYDVDTEVVRTKPSTFTLLLS